MAEITKAQMDAWAARMTPGRYIVRLEAGDSIPWSGRAHPDRTFSGPAVVEVVRMRDGSWEVYETPLMPVAVLAGRGCPERVTLPSGEVMPCLASLPHGEGHHLF